MLFLLLQQLVQCGFVAFLVSNAEYLCGRWGTFPVFVDRQDPWNSNAFGNIFSTTLQDGHYLSKYRHTYICLTIHLAQLTFYLANFKSINQSIYLSIDYLTIYLSDYSSLYIYLSMEHFHQEMKLRYSNTHTHTCECENECESACSRNWVDRARSHSYT